MKFGVFVFLFLVAGGEMLSQSEGCRLKSEDIRPLIVPHNPFFSSHYWDPELRKERARMDEFRMLIIQQDGCLRHHTRFAFRMAPPAVRENSLEFWMQEIQHLMDRVYFAKPEYAIFRQPFEEGLEEGLYRSGLLEPFNFPVGTRNFICQIQYDKKKGAKIEIEMIEYLFKEGTGGAHLRKPDVHDDGWLGRAPLSPSKP